MVRDCREPGCDRSVLLARTVPECTWTAYDAEEVLPGAGAVEAHVVVIGQAHPGHTPTTPRLSLAWRPADLLDDVRYRYELSEVAARQLVDEFPLHRPHEH